MADGVGGWDEGDNKDDPGFGATGSMISRVAVMFQLVFDSLAP